MTLPVHDRYRPLQSWQASGHQAAKLMLLAHIMYRCLCVLAIRAPPHAALPLAQPQHALSHLVGCRAHTDTEAQPSRRASEAPLAAAVRSSDSDADAVQLPEQLPQAAALPPQQAQQQLQAASEAKPEQPHVALFASWLAGHKAALAAALKAQQAEEEANVRP